MSISKVVLCTAVLCCLLCVALSTTSTTTYYSSCSLACLCEEGSNINCSSLGLKAIPRLIPAAVTSLNISHNALRSLPPLGLASGPTSGILGGLRHLWLGSNHLVALSLCVKRARKDQMALIREEPCSSWAPALEQLSAERNQIQRIPRGLGGSSNLQVLQLSHNEISVIGKSDFWQCRHLKELYLQSNRIRTIHPLAFRDLVELQVFDLRSNLLVSLPSPVYLSLFNMRTQVALGANRWRCDCNLQGLKDMIVKKNLDQSTDNWVMVCSSPLNHNGKRLTHLTGRDLTCPGNAINNVHHFEETAEEGSRVLLPCGTSSQDCSNALWWTPHGQASGTDHGFIISDVREGDAGLYISVSGQQGEQVSVFDLHVLQKTTEFRLKREVKNMLLYNGGQTERNTRASGKTLAEFNLAVCLSVFITFIVAFIIGVLVRPCLDQLWGKIRSKRSPSASPSPNHDESLQDSSVYENEGFTMTDEPGHVRAGQRVTFSDVTETREQDPVNGDTSSESSFERENMYQNVNEDHETIENLEMQQHGSRNAQDPDHSSHGEKQLGDGTSEGSKAVEFEPIPDPAELKRRTSSISSASTVTHEQGGVENIYENIQDSTGDEEGNKPQADVIFESSEKQKSRLSPVVNPEAISVFTQDPFTEWPSQQMDRSTDQSNHLDPELWNDSGESFSFTDNSELSCTKDTSRTRAIQPVDVSSGTESDRPMQKQPERTHNIGADDVSRQRMSISSEDSDDEPTEYTVNPETSEEEDGLMKINAPTSIVSSQLITSTAQDEILGNRSRADTILLEPGDIQLAIIHDSSDQGAIDDGSVFIDRDPLSQGLPVPLPPPQPSYPARRDRFSSSEGEEEPKKYNVHPVYRRRPVLISTASESYSERLSLSSDCEEDPIRTWPETNTSKGVSLSDIESRPIINTSSLRDTSNLPIKKSGTILNIDFDSSATNTDDFENVGMNHIEGMIKGVSLDHIPFPKRALVFKVKDETEYQQRRERSWSPSNSSPGETYVPKLPGTRGSSQQRPRSSSHSSTSPDEGSPNGKTHPPPSQISELLKDLSLDELPLARRALDIRVNTDEDHSQMSKQYQKEFDFSPPESVTPDLMIPKPPGRLKPSVSSQSSLSSNDEYPGHPPSPPQLHIGDMMTGVPFEQIPYPKKVLVFGIKGEDDGQFLEAKQPKELSKSLGAPFRPAMIVPKLPSRSRASMHNSVSSEETFHAAINTSEYEKEVFDKRIHQVGRPKYPPPPVPIPLQCADQQKPHISSQSSVSSDEEVPGQLRYPAVNNIEGMMKGVVLDQIPLAKKALDIRVRDDEVYAGQGFQIDPTTVSKGQQRPRLASQSSVSSDEGASGQPVPTQPTNIQGMLRGVSLDQIPLAKKALDIRVRDDELYTQDLQQDPITVSQSLHQQRPRLSSQSSINSDEGVSSQPEPRPPTNIEGMIRGVSLDQIPLAKKALDIRVRDDEVYAQQGIQIDPTTVSKGQHRPRLASQSSVSSDEGSSGQLQSPPPTNIEGMMKGVSLDQIPLAKRALDIRVRDNKDYKQRSPSEYYTSDKQLLYQQRPIGSSQSSGSSDEETSYQLAPPSPTNIDGVMRGVSLERIPLAKRSLDIRVKDHWDNKETIQATQGQTDFSLSQQPKLSITSQSSVSSTEDSQPKLLSRPPTDIVGMLEGASLDQVPLAKRGLDFRVKSSENPEETLKVNEQQSSLKFSLSPLVVGPARPRVSSQSSVSSDDGPPKRSPSPPPTQIEGMFEGVVLDHVPLVKRSLHFKVKDTEVYKQELEVNQSQSNLISSSKNVGTPNLTGTQLSNQQRERLQSQSSESSDEESLSHQSSSNSRQIGGMIRGVSLDRIPLAKRALDIRVKTSDQLEIGQTTTCQSQLSSSVRSAVAQDLLDSQGSLNKPSITKRPLLVIRSENTTVARTNDAAKQNTESKPNMSSHSSDSSDDNELLNRVQLSMERQRLQRRLLLTSSMDEQILQRQTHSPVQLDTKVSQLNNSYEMSANQTDTDSLLHNPFSLENIPKPKRSLQFTSSDFSTSIQRGLTDPDNSDKYRGNVLPKVPSSVNAKGWQRREDPFSLDKVPTVRRSLAFSLPTDTTNLFADRAKERKPSGSSESSDDSNQPNHYLRQDQTYTNNESPLSTKSFKFISNSDSNTTPKAVAPPTLRYQPPLPSQTDLPGTYSSVPKQYLYSNIQETPSDGQQSPAESSYLPRGRAMDGFTSQISPQTSLTSLGPSIPSRSSLLGYSGAIPYHANNTFQRVSMGNSSAASKSDSMSDNSDLSATFPNIQRPRRFLQGPIEEDGYEV